MNSKKELAVELSRLEKVPNPQVELEQYPTDSESAANILWEAGFLGDIEGKTALDLCCGNGILGLTTLLLGATHCTFVDIDPESLAIAKKNYAHLKSEGWEIGEATFLTADILHTNIPPADLVVMNPPFGTRTEGADIALLERAKALGTIIYTFHKTSTDTYVEAAFQRLGLAIGRRWDIQLLIPKLYEHHKKKTERVKVSVWRLLQAP